MLTHVLFDRARQPVCFSLTTKDRVSYSLEAVRGLGFEGGFDLLWFDGSASSEGRQLPGTLAPTLGCLREIHTGVVGGPDFAIFAALTRMVELGYDYCGLLENDVALSPDWLKAMMATFAAGAADGLTVGAVTARAFNRRVLYHRGSYAVTMVSGAGMILFTREAAEIVLRNYRTTSAFEINSAILHISGKDFGRIENGAGASTSAVDDTRTASDLVYDTQLLRRGLCVLATVPVYGRNLDPVDPTGLLGGYIDDKRPAADDAESFRAFVVRCAANRGVSEPYAPPYLYFGSMRLWCLFVHHLLFTRGSPATIRGRWQIVGDKFSGPFAFEALDPDCELSFPLYGALKGLFCARTADGGLVELVQGERRLGEFDSYYGQTVRDQFLMPLDITSTGAEPVRLRVVGRSPASSGQRFRLTGLCFAQPQPWLSPRADLDWARLARVLEAQSRDEWVAF